MRKYQLTIEDFREEGYREIETNIWVHPQMNDLNTPIFRYEKACHLIQEISYQKLHFSNRLLFPDMREWGYKSDKRLWFPLHPASSKDILGNGDEDITRRFSASLFSVGLSCWTLDSITGASEDILKWRYFKGDVRIKTTIRKLISNFQNNKTVILFSFVRYENERIFNTAQNSIFTKTPYYRAEEELRLCALSDDPHLYVDFNYDESIEEILISPFYSEANFLINNPVLKKKYEDILKMSNIIERQ